jgi:hypothetical protein
MAELFDKKGKDTGRGKIREQVVKQHGIEVIADLYNYNIDGNVLKDEHKKWIDIKLLPLLRAFSVHVKLRGTASKTGDREYNRQLSLGRILRVKKYVIEHGIPESKVPGPDIQAAGEDLSTSDFDEDERDRAVRITVAMGTKPRPIFPTIVLPEIVITSDDPTIEVPPTIIVVPRPRPSPRTTRGPKFSREFEIKQLGEGSLSVFKIIGASGMFLLIRDITNREEIVCVAPGVGTGIGLPVSVTLEGPFNHFTTSTPQELRDFAGRAIWQTLFTAGPFSKSRISFLDVPSGASSTKTVTVPMNTGITFGAAAFAPTAIRLFCSEPMPF